MTNNCHRSTCPFFLFCPDESNSIPVFWPLFSANGMVCPVCYSCTFSLVLGEWGVRGRCPFKWSTWRLWPVINEFAVTHGSCKETSGSKGERESTKEGAGGYSGCTKTFYLCTGEKWLRRTCYHFHGKKKWWGVYAAWFISNHNDKNCCIAWEVNVPQKT